MRKKLCGGVAINKMVDIHGNLGLCINDTAVCGRRVCCGCG